MAAASIASIFIELWHNCPQKQWQHHLLYNMNIHDINDITVHSIDSSIIYQSIDVSIGLEKRCSVNFPLLFCKELKIFQICSRLGSLPLLTILLGKGHSDQGLVHLPQPNIFSVRRKQTEHGSQQFH